MSIEAKPVVKNKYWIVEDSGRKIGTIQASENGVVLVKGNHRLKYPSIKVLGITQNIKFVRSQKTQVSSKNLVYDYPSKSTPFNAVYDLKLKLPLYTPSNKSKSFYCAGYYLIKYDDNYIVEFCPKKIILIRNSFYGPFKSRDQAEQARHDIK